MCDIGFHFVWQKVSVGSCEDDMCNSGICGPLCRGCHETASATVPAIDQIHSKRQSPSVMKIWRKEKHARRGTAMVEMALVLPLFLTLILGMIEFGRAMMIANLVTNAAREGARMAVLDGSSNATVTDGIKTFLQSAIGVTVLSSDIGVTITVTPAAGNPNVGNVIASAKSRDLIAVNVALPFNKVALIPGNYLNGQSLVGKSAMRHE